MLDREKRIALYYGAIGLSALLLFATFHPVDWHWLAWLALVPMLLASSVFTRYRDVFALGTSVGLLFHMVGLGWLALCSPESWVITVILEGLYMGLSVFLTTYVHRRLKLPYGFVLPVIWTALDFERARFKFFAFPWMLISQSQHSHDWLIQIVDVTGVYGPGVFVLMCNGLLLDTLLVKTQLREWFKAPGAVLPAYSVPFKRIGQGWGLLAGLLLVATIYGAVRVGQVRAGMKESANILAIQSDFPSRNDRPPLDAHYVTSRILDQTELAIQKHIGKYDLVVWPETTWYYPLNADFLRYIRINRMNYPAERRLKFDQFLNNHRRLMMLPKLVRADILIGAIHHEFEERRLIPKHNSAYWLTHEHGDIDNTEKRIKGRFDKLNLVPASEYIPGKDTVLFHWFFRLMQSMVPEGFAVFDHGLKPEIFEIKGHKLAPNICFDVSFGQAMRDATLRGADLHVNMSNYSWFRSSQALDFVLIQGKFRAIETRRGVVKVINGGPTSAFDPDGQIADSGKAILPHFTAEELQKSGRGTNQGALLVRTKTTNFKSFYVRFGDVFAWILVFGALAFVLVAWKKPCNETDASGDSRNKAA
jgi:apolipoprotein N-acyltransferase